MLAVFGLLQVVLLMHIVFSTVYDSKGRIRGEGGPSTRGARGAHPPQWQGFQRDFPAYQECLQQGKGQRKISEDNKDGLRWGTINCSIRMWVCGVGCLTE